MWKSLFVVLLFVSFSVRAQDPDYAVKKENLTKKETLYYDFNRSKIQMSGAYYTDKAGATTMKHGKWLYYDRDGKLEEERNYYKDLLHGKVLLLYPNGKPKQEGYFVLNQPDSVYREWNELGKLAVEGRYAYGKPSGTWTTYYLDGRKQSEEVVRNGVNLMESF